MKHNKFLILGGVALSCVYGSAVAQSSVSMYGIVDAALGYTSNQAGGSKVYVRSGNKDASRLGFRGTEDLGGGTSVIFQLEAGFNIDDGTSQTSGSLFNRAAWVGMSDKQMGTLTVGRQYSPYYTFLSPLGPVPAVTGATGAHPGDIDGFDVTIRNSNSVSYVSPSWHGLNLGAMAAAGEQAGHNGSGGELSTAVKYEAGPWRFGVGYQVLKNGQNPTTWDTTASSSFTKSPINAGYVSAKQVQYVAAAARYQSGALGLGGTFSNVQYVADGRSLFRDTAIFNTAAVLATWQTSTPWLLGVSLSDTRATAANGINDSAKYRQLALQQSYWLSKRTALYLLETVQRATGKTIGTNGVSQINATATVGDSQAATPSTDGSQHVFMAGIRHAF